MDTHVCVDMYGRNLSSILDSERQTDRQTKRQAESARLDLCVNEVFMGGRATREFILPRKKSRIPETHTYTRTRRTRSTSGVVVDVFASNGKQKRDT